MLDLIFLLATVGFSSAPSLTRTGAAKFDPNPSHEIHLYMGTIIIGIIATLLLVYLFATMIYPEKF